MIWLNLCCIVFCINDVLPNYSRITRFDNEQMTECSFIYQDFRTHCEHEVQYSMSTFEFYVSEHVWYSVNIIYACVMLPISIHFYTEEVSTVGSKILCNKNNKYPVRIDKRSPRSPPLPLNFTKSLSILFSFSLSLYDL